MASFVVDASVALAWCFDDEATGATDALLGRAAAEGVVVPALWFLEVANALLTAERRGRLTPAQTLEVLTRLAALPAERDSVAVSPTAVLALARAQRLTAYDAAYLELAIRRELPLATLDEELRRAGQAAGVPLL